MRLRHVGGWTWWARLAVVAASASVLAASGVSNAHAHGYTEAPTSRARWCQMGQVSGCGAAQYEPQSVEGPKGFPVRGPRDGQICSAGIDRFSELNDPTKNWPLSEVQPGAQFDFEWKLTASHRTTRWAYYVTKDNWDPSKPLTRAALEREPFFVEESDGQTYPPSTVIHTGVLPENKYGRHLILGVWEIADTPNAFYSCADVNFG